MWRHLYIKYLIYNDWEQNVLSGLEVLGILFKSELDRSDTNSGTGFILYIVKILKIDSFKKYKRIKKNKKSFKIMSSSPTGALQRCPWRGFSLLIVGHGAKAGLQRRYCRQGCGVEPVSRLLVTHTQTWIHTLVSTHSESWVRSTHLYPGHETWWSPRVVN